MYIYTYILILCLSPVISVVPCTSSKVQTLTLMVNIISHARFLVRRFPKVYIIHYFVLRIISRGTILQNKYTSFLEYMTGFIYDRISCLAFDPIVVCTRPETLGDIFTVQFRAILH